jgi:hypothetical protein
VQGVGLNIGERRRKVGDSKIMQDFDATELVKNMTGKRQVTQFNSDMAVCMNDGIVIITRQQAKDFFGLRDSDEGECAV